MRRQCRDIAGCLLKMNITEQWISVLDLEETSTSGAGLRTFYGVKCH